MAGTSRSWKPCVFSGRNFKGTWGYPRDVALIKGEERVFVRGGCHRQLGQEEMGYAVCLKGGSVGQAVPAGHGLQGGGAFVL